MTQGWIVWALLSAVFAALTTVFARVGVAGVDADLATLLRTVLIVVLLVALVLARHQWPTLRRFPAGRSRSWRSAQDWVGLGLVTAGVLALALK